MSAAGLQTSLDIQRAFYRQIVRILAIALGLIIVIVGIGQGIVTYNSVANAPKIDCIYKVSLSTNHDIYRLITTHDSNLDHYTYATCPK